MLGVLPTYIYVSAVLAFPSRWRDKAWGILIGIPSILFINEDILAPSIVKEDAYNRWRGCDRRSIYRIGSNHKSMRRSSQGRRNCRL